MIGDRSRRAVRPYRLRSSTALREALATERSRVLPLEEQRRAGSRRSGDSDLDLLVARRDLERFTAVIRDLGFRMLARPSIKQVPGVFHCLRARRAVRQARAHPRHYRLVLGDDTTKNYRLPIEEAYLAFGRSHEARSAPDPGAGVRARRLRRAHGAEALDLGRDRIAQGAARPERGEGARVPHCDAPTSTHARAIVREHLPFIGVELWDRCRRASRGGDRPAWTGSAPAHRSSVPWRRTRDAGPAPTRW